MSGLSKVGVSAFKWGAVSAVGRFALQLVAQVLLARMLGPDNYGVFGIGMLVLTLSTFLTNFGFGWNLLHKPNLTDQDIRFAFTWQVMAGLTAVLALQVGAGWLAIYFREPRVESVIRWLSLACLVSAAASPSLSLMQRELKFKTLGLIQIGSYFLGYVCVGVGLAYLGAGAAALVAAWMTQAVVSLVATFAARPHPIRPLFRYPGAAAAFRLGGLVFLNNVVNWGLTNIDRVALGRLLNAEAVGHYAVGYNLAAMPNTLLLAALQPAFTAAGAQMGGDRQRLRTAYLQIISTVLVLITPGYVVLSVMSNSLIAFLYGAQWVLTGDILTILFLGMPMLVIWGVTTPVLTNTGRLHHESMLQAPVLLAGTAAFFAFTTKPTVAAWIAVGVLAARTLMLGFSACHVLNIRARVLVGDLLRGALLSSTCGGVAYVAIWTVGPLQLPLVELVCGGLAALLVGGLIIFFWPRVLGDAASRMLLRFYPGANRWLKLMEGG